MTKLLAGAAIVAALAAIGCGGSTACLTTDQAAAKIAQVDTYSWYDPANPKTLERLSPEKVTKVLAIERQECTA